jgi:type I restriction enzyme, S subunit
MGSEGWPEVRLVDIQADVPNAIAAGPFGSNLVRADYRSSGVPVIRGSNLDGSRGRFNDKEFVYVSAAKADSMAGNLARSGDIIVTQRGTLGQVGLIPEDGEHDRFVLSQSQMKLTCDRDKADPLFVFYWLSGSATVDYIKRSAVATGVPHINLSFFREMRMPLPPLPKQREIARILAALDDMIELNRRTNRTLESIARAIFESWFVDFDPVRAKEDGRWREGQSLPGLPAHLYDLLPDRLADSGVGNSPEGWEVGTLGDLSLKPQYGYTASAKSEPIGPKFLRITDINKSAWIEWGSVPYCEMEDGDREKYRLHKGDVLIARMADPGHGVMIEDDQDAVFASYLIRFRPRNVEYSRFLQYWLRSRSYWELVKGRGAGTTRVSLNAQVLSSFPLVIPPRSVASAFAELVGCLRVRVVANASETQLLAAARDALLPKLISGELQVRDAKHTVGGVGA